MSERERFEAFVGAPPFELPTQRNKEDGSSAWPGQYRECFVEAMWCSWQAAKAEAAERERALVAEVERLREAGRSALAYLEGCNGLAVAVPIGMLRAALAQHESKEASDE